MTTTTADPLVPPGRRDEAQPAGEGERLAALHAYAVLDTPAEEAFDDFTAIASRITGAPIALISLVDRHRQWFKSRVGLDAAETPREWAFCDRTIRQAGLLEVADATLDARFADNPLVLGAPGIRFYAGAPLVTPGGQAIGTLCVIDRHPRRLDAEQHEMLRRLARQVVHLLELRRISRLQRDTEAQLRQREAERARLALVAERTAHTVLMTDAEGRITWFNEAFGRASGLGAAECLGRRPDEIEGFPLVEPEGRRLIEQACTGRRAAKVRTRRLEASGVTRWLDFDLQPILDASGSYQGHIVVATDVTELVVQHERSRALLEALPVAVMALDRDMGVQAANASAARMLGRPVQDLLGMNLLADPPSAIGLDQRPFPPSRNPAYLSIRDGQPRSGEVVGVQRSDAERRWLQLSSAALKGADGRVDGAILCAMDVTEQRLQSELLSLATRAARIVPWRWSATRDEVRFDATAARMAGVQLPGAAQGECGAAAFRAAVHPDDRAPLAAALRQHGEGGKELARAEFRLPGRDGDWRWLLLVGAVTERDAAGDVARLQGILLDIHDQKQAEQALRTAATTDRLTGLPNRALLADRLQRALVSARRHGRAGALLFVDLDHFKRVNDVHGHQVGDRVLQEATKLLRAQLREEDTLARMGGDEFIVLLPHAGESLALAGTATEGVGRKLLAALARPLRVGGLQIDLGASIGFTVFPKTDAETEDDLIREADTAMYAAKAAGRGTQSVYAVGMQQDLARRLELERDLRHAVENHELEIHLQGKWQPDGGLVGVEALLRWQHPRHGAVSPAQFIPIAEDSALILELGRWVFQQACDWLALQQARGCALPVAVNVSPRQLRDPRLAGELSGIAAAAGVRADRLTLEITEGVLLDEGAREQLHALADAGFRISIDDFGTGYSSLLYLKRLPVHEIKIDRGFVRDLGQDAEDAVIVEAMLSLARNFGIAVVAEGVETALQASFLAARGCVVHQGYLYDRPQPARAFDPRLMRSARAAAAAVASDGRGAAEVEDRASAAS